MVDFILVIILIIVLFMVYKQMSCFDELIESIEYPTILIIYDDHRIHRDMLDVQVYSLIGKQKYEELYQENIELLQTIEDIERLIKHLYDQKKNKC